MRRLALMTVALLGLVVLAADPPRVEAQIVGPNNRPAGARFFQYTDHARKLLRFKVEQTKQYVLIGLLEGITTGRDPESSGWVGASPEVTEPRYISGFADEGHGSFAYEGTVDIQEGYLVIDIVSQPESETWTDADGKKQKNAKWRKRERRTVATIYEEGPVDIDVSY